MTSVSRTCPVPFHMIKYFFRVQILLDKYFQVCRFNRYFSRFSGIFLLQVLASSSVSPASTPPGHIKLLNLAESTLKRTVE